MNTPKGRLPVEAQRRAQRGERRPGSGFPCSYYLVSNGITTFSTSASKGGEIQ